MTPYLIIGIIGIIMLVAGVIILGYALIVFALDFIQKYKNGGKKKDE